MLMLHLGLDAPCVRLPTVDHESAVRLLLCILKHQVLLEQFDRHFDRVYISIVDFVLEDGSPLGILLHCLCMEDIAYAHVGKAALATESIALGRLARTWTPEHKDDAKAVITYPGRYFCFFHACYQVSVEHRVADETLL